MSGLPSIRELPVFADNLHTLRFVQPSIGNGVVPLYQTDSKSSPRPRLAAIRILTLYPCTIVPVHIHRNKEKIYMVRGLSTHLQIVIWDEGVPTTYIAQHQHDCITVPAGCPHALIYSSTHASEFSVFTTSQDPDDIEWESDLETLLRNEHLQPR